MRLSTAVRRLRSIAERAQQVSPFASVPALLSVYAFGPVLESPADLDYVQVACVVDLPLADVIWGTSPPWAASLAHLLEMDKAPVERHWRPTEWPVSNHAIRRPLRLWSASEGIDVSSMDALSTGRVESLRLPEPHPAVLREQLAAELAASLTHVRQVEELYWEADWRRGHRGDGFHPEDHLWRAVHGYLDLLAAVHG
ncbi:DUF7711 family protein [Hamadaea tsunoensis]|uniref:DUF7711 family protein n=1 Tax=Hamadaea tsunoensis TaxID=53368 RepID=UPI0004279026|nr:hypothetical protein [Hamadaea tsunoensis]